MKRLIYIGIIIVLVFFISVFFAKKSGPKTSGIVEPSPSTYQLPTVNSWEGVIPGGSFEEDVLRRLGKPEKISNKGVSQVYIYPSTNQYWKNEVVVSNKQVIFIKERLFPPQEQSYLKLAKIISDPPTRLYGPDHDSGMYLMTYPASGLAYLVHVPKDTIYEVWRFQPTTLRVLLDRSEFSGYDIAPIPKRE